MSSRRTAVAASRKNPATESGRTSRRVLSNRWRAFWSTPSVCAHRRTPGNPVSIFRASASSRTADRRIRSSAARRSPDLMRSIRSCSSVVLSDSFLTPPPPFRVSGYSKRPIRVMRQEIVTRAPTLTHVPPRGNPSPSHPRHLRGTTMPTRSRWHAFALAAGLLAVGCTKNAPPSPPAPAPDTPVEIPADPADRYDQSFAKAATDEIGEDQVLPPDRTVADKSTAVLREAVEQVWPTIRLTDAAGKPLPWVVTLDTDAGGIEIALRPDIAPNHCRNLLALVKVGYYDGL